MTRFDRLLQCALLVSLSVTAISAQAGKPIFDARRCALEVVDVPEEKRLKIQDLLEDPETTQSPQEVTEIQVRSIEQMLDFQYGPLVKKTRLFSAGWRTNWEGIKQRIVEFSAGLKTHADRYWFIADFLHRLFRDAHVSVDVPSTKVFRFPIQLEAAEGKFVVNYVDGTFPSTERRPEPGDEIISINGLSPRNFQAQFAQWTGDGNLASSDGFFAVTFTRWAESRGIPLSELPARFKNLEWVLRENPSGEVYKIKTQAREEGETIASKALSANQRFALPAKARPKFIKDHKVNAVLTRLEKLGRSSVNFEEAGGRWRRFEFREGIDYKSEGSSGRRIEIGAEEPFFQLPKDFKKFELPEAAKQLPIIEHIFNGNSIFAGTFMRNGKRVGLIRIHSYDANLDGLKPFLNYVIGRLQQETDHLYFDQTNNPGGYVIYSDWVIKAFAGKYDHDKHMKFSLKPTEKALNDYESLIAEIQANEFGRLTEAEIKDFVTRLEADYAKVQKAFDSNKSLSEPVSMLVTSEYYELMYMRELEEQLAKGPSGFKDAIVQALGVDIFKHQTYTKDIDMVINVRDASGGDATPGGLADYGRVRLFGTRTAGAGGTVEDFSIRGIVDMVIRLTTSLMVRHKGVLVEGYGVDPHIKVPVLISDVKNQYATYLDRVMDAADNDRGRTP